MREILSFTGLWRVPALVETLTRKEGGVFETPYGRFRTPDFASAFQFWEGCQPKVRAIISSLRRGLFVDVGANIGLYTMIAAKGGNSVIAFEPNPKAYSCLLDNIYYNGFSHQVIAVNAACWDTNAELHLKVGAHTDTSTVSDEGLRIRGVTLDSWVDSAPLLIKTDAEGSDARVLRGAKEILARYKPRVIFEALTPKAVKECTEVLPGYHIERIERTNYLAR